MNYLLSKVVEKFSTLRFVHSNHPFIHNFADVYVLHGVNKSGGTGRLLSKIVCVYGTVLPVDSGDIDRYIP